MNLPTYSSIKENLREHPKKWLVTGAAGFIGSHLVETLLKLNQKVIGLDNFSIGYKHNLDQALKNVKLARKTESCELNTCNFTFIDGDITKLEDCQKAIECQNNLTSGTLSLEPHKNEVVDFVLHHAALCSVPGSLEDPIKSNASNVTGFLNMLLTARDAKVKRFVYAASSATYGDDGNIPAKEEQIGNQLSPYALSKYINELYSDIFARCYDTESIGLRYFNVFGSRQDPNGAYSAVVARWIAAILKGATVEIYGDGKTSRDFCYIDNVVQANILAAMSENPEAVNQVYNIAIGERTTLNQLYKFISKESELHYKNLIDNSNPNADCKLQVENLESTEKLVYKDFRSGDVRHSQADITKARTLLGYTPTHTVEQGLAKTIKWYANNL